MRKVILSGACVLALSGLSVPVFAADPAEQAATKPQLSCEEQYLQLQENYASLLIGNASVQRKNLQLQQQLRQSQSGDEKTKARAEMSTPASSTPGETPPNEPPH